MSGVDRFDWRPERQLAADLLEKVGIPVGPFAKYAESVRERRAARIGSLLGGAAELASSTPTHLLEVASQYDRIAELLAAACDAAAVSASPGRVRVLSRVLAAAIAGAGDEVAIDDVELVMATVVQLEPVHVRALYALERSGPFPVDDGGNYERLPESFDLIAAELGSPTLAAPVERRLLDLALLNPGVRFDDRHVHLVTPFGRRVLGFLEDQDPA